MKFPNPSMAGVLVVWLILPSSVRGGAAGQSTPLTTNAAPRHVWATKLDRPGLKNLHCVTTNLYRGAQPTAAGMRGLEALGIKTVINLRPRNADQSRIKGTRLQLVHLGWNAWHPEDKDVIQFLKIVTDPSRGPVYVHCQHGSDRTGMMVAIYRVAAQGWSKEEAIQEMTKGGFGFHRLWTNLIRYVRQADIESLRRRAGLGTGEGPGSASIRPKSCPFVGSLFHPSELGRVDQTGFPVFHRLRDPRNRK